MFGWGGGGRPEAVLRPLCHFRPRDVATGRTQAALIDKLKLPRRVAIGSK